MPSPILFFDGVCGICNHFVKFLFQVDRKAVFKVATLQGSFAQKNLPKALTQELSSLVVLTDKGETLTKSRAVLFVLRSVGGIWRMLAAAAGILPTNVLDRIYERVARNRYRFFGKLESCRVPTPEEKMRFIDDRHHPPA